jgi:Tfp pilus assembly protein PilN
LKLSNYKKVVGLAIGERSLMAAELLAGDPPQVKRLAEMVYPQGLGPANPAELGKALGQFLRDNQFTAHAAIVGIPAKWLVVKSKEVPSADRATLAEMLRLQAEAEFASDLKDLVYDYSGDSQPSAAGGTKSVLLMATPKKYVDSAAALCQAAGLRAIAVTPSALALGAASSRSSDKNVLVLSVGPGGSELSAQQSGWASALRHLRSPNPQPPFVSELRRAVSTLGPASADRELILWDGAGMDAGALGDQLGLRVRGGDVPLLGVDASSAGMNGQGLKFAAAIALALSGLKGLSVDFLHSRLAPPAQRSWQRLIGLGALAAVVVIGGLIWAYADMQHRRGHVAALQRQLAQIKDSVGDARKFVDMVNFAEYWHGENPQYLDCLRDLTNAIPDDGQTYATSLDMTAETPHMAVTPPPGAPTPPPAKAEAPHTLAVKLAGRTSDAENVTALVDRMRHNPAFVDIRIGQETNTGRSREWSFSLTFTYVPPPRK